MGIRAFLAEHPAGPELAALVAAAQAREVERGYARSPIGALAGLFLDEGRDGVVAVARKLADGAVSVEPDQVALGRLAPRDALELEEDLGAVLLGAAVLAVEEALVARQVDLLPLWERLDAALTGTPFPKPATPELWREEVGPDQWRAMLRCADADKTLSGFFAEGCREMPPLLRQYVAEVEVYPALEALVPAYQARARGLVGAADPPTA